MIWHEIKWSEWMKWNENAITWNRMNRHEWMQWNKIKCHEIKWKRTCDIIWKLNNRSFETLFTYPSENFIVTCFDKTVFLLILHARYNRNQTAHNLDNYPLIINEYRKCCHHLTVCLVFPRSNERLVQHFLCNRKCHRAIESEYERGFAATTYIQL